jgi:hypothetical protein
VASTSSYIFRAADNQILQGEGGKRIIIPVDDAGASPAISEYAEKQLWLHGYGRHKITRAGTTAQTTIFDLCYGKQPERISNSHFGDDLLE